MPDRQLTIALTIKTTYTDKLLLAANIFYKEVKDKSNLLPGFIYS